jgi:hypothetical protein
MGALGKTAIRVQETHRIATSNFQEKARIRPFIPRSKSNQAIEANATRPANLSPPLAQGHALLCTQLSSIAIESHYGPGHALALSRGCIIRYWRRNRQKQPETQSQWHFHAQWRFR